MEHLKYAAPGFVYSVGIAPALAAASLAALRVMQKEPERVQKLQHNTRFFLQQARAAGLDIGMSQGHSIIPLMTGSSIKAAKLSSQLFEHGINVQPILHPAVEEKAARLRFFLSSEHNQAQMEFSIQTIQELTS